MSQGLCPSCGAAVKLTAGQTDTKCQYCDSVVTLQQAEAQASEVKHSKFAGTLMIAETAQEGGSYAEAINYFNKVIEQEPSFADAWLNKGICLVRTSKIGDLKIPEAISSWKAAIKFAKNPEAMKKRVALEIATVIASFSPVLIDHYIKFHSVEGALVEHFERFYLLESALSLAMELSPCAEISKVGIYLCDGFTASALRASSSGGSYVVNAAHAAILFDKGWLGSMKRLAYSFMLPREIIDDVRLRREKYERLADNHEPSFEKVPPALDSRVSTPNEEPQHQAKADQGAGIRGVKRASRQARNIIQSIAYAFLTLFLGVVALFGILSVLAAIATGNESFGSKAGLTLFGLSLAVGGICGILKIRKWNAASKE